MARLGRPGGLSAAGKKELWERWRAGESVSDIARALQKPPGSVHGMLRATGGISPPQRRRRRCALTLAEREEISRGLASGDSMRAIAARLVRHVSTLKAELVSRLRFPSRQAAKTAIFDYLETFYNIRRLHSSLGYMSPADFEEDRIGEARVV
ncbi:MAG: helix-turn-helix domain-containing protein [Rubrobacteraceae bacterium]